MSLARHAKKRDVNEREIVEALRSVGCVVEYLDRPVDLLVGHRGRTWLLEVKQPKKKLTTGQSDFLERWQGGPVYVVRSVDEALAAVREG